MRKTAYTCLMKRAITKEAVIEMLGGVTNTAKFYGIEPQAIYQWPDNELIPELREIQLRYKRPELFQTT